MKSRMKQGHLSHVSLLHQFYPTRLKNSAVRGNDCQDPPPENKLIPRLIIVAPVQMRRLAVHTSCQFSDYLKPNPFSLCSDSHIHFLLNPLTATIWFFDLVYIIALYLSQKLPSMEMAVTVLVLVSHSRENMYFRIKQRIGLPLDMILLKKIRDLPSMISAVRYCQKYIVNDIIENARTL